MLEKIQRTNIRFFVPLDVRFNNTRTLALQHPEVGMKTSGGWRKMILEVFSETPGCFSANLLDHQPLTPGPFTAKMLKKITREGSFVGRVWCRFYRTPIINCKLSNCKINLVAWLCRRTWHRIARVCASIGCASIATDVVRGVWSAPACYSISRSVPSARRSAACR